MFGGNSCVWDNDAPGGECVPECVFAHLATLVEVGGGKIAMGRRYIERHFMAGAKMGYSSICLIFKLKVGRACCSFARKGWHTAAWAWQKRPLLPLSAKCNWEQWQLKSDASVYSSPPRAIVCPAYSHHAHYLDQRFTCGTSVWCWFKR